MKLPAYPKYKPSGIEWLGEVPENWEVKRLQYLFRFTSGGTPQTETAEYWDGTIPWVSPKDMKVFLLTDTIDHVSELALRETSTTEVSAGTMLIVARSGILRHSIPVSIATRRMTINQDIKGVFPLRPNVSVSYFARCIEGHQTELLTLWRKEGATVESLELNLVKAGSFPFPPLPEQQAIAAFLDRETGRLDRLVAKKRELIERLKEKRVALISRSVTRGLPPEAARAAGLPENPRMKPSGIEWLGEVPEHWEVWKHAHLFSSSMGQTILKEDVADSGTIPVLSATEKYEIFGYLESASVLLNPSDLVIPARGNSIGHVKLVRERSTTTQTTIYSKHLTKKVSAGFAFYFLMGHRNTLFHFDRTAIPQLTVNQVSTNPFLLPPFSEQTAIAAFLDKETAHLDALLSKVEQAVERLQEYRTALITEAVTGKIDVRRKTAKNPEGVDYEN